MLNLCRKHSGDFNCSSFVSLIKAQRPEACLLTCHLPHPRDDASDQPHREQPQARNHTCTYDWTQTKTMSTQTLSLIPSIPQHSTWLLVARGLNFGEPLSVGIFHTQLVALVSPPASRTSTPRACQMLVGKPPHFFGMSAAKTPWPLWTLGLSTDRVAALTF